MKELSLLTKQGEQVVSDLKMGQNILIYGIIGMGINTIVKEVVKKYVNDTKNYVINLYPHESYFKDYNDIEKLLLDKITLENILSESNIYSMQSFIKSLEMNNKSLLVVINKLDDHINSKKYLLYLESLYKASNQRIILLISAHTSLFSKFKREELLVGTSDYIFRGFLEEFDILFERMVTQRNISKEIYGYKDKMFDYTLGHTGLLKFVLLNCLRNKKLLSPKELLEDGEILRRSSLVFQALSNLDISMSSDIFTKKTSTLEKYGLYYKGKYGLLFKEYLLSNELQKQDVFKLLTKLEEDIFRILSDNSDKYMSLDQLAFSLEGVNLGNISDWALYKHINNINKKLAQLSIYIENKRGYGYKVKSL